MKYLINFFNTLNIKKMMHFWNYMYMLKCPKASLNANFWHFLILFQFNLYMRKVL